MKQLPLPFAAGLRTLARWYDRLVIDAPLWKFAISVTVIWALAGVVIGVPLRYGVQAITLAHQRAAAAHERAVIASDPNDIQACQLVRAWYSGEGPDKLYQALPVAAHAADPYLRYWSGNGDGLILLNACKADGFDMARRPASPAATHTH